MFRKKLGLIMILALLVSVMIAGSAFAIEYVAYDDTGSDGFDAPPEGDPISIVDNGDFKLWPEGKPYKWTMRDDGKAGWLSEGAHIAQMDYAIVHDTADQIPGVNDALGIFVRNVGGSGSFYAYASQAMNFENSGSGYYWVTVHTTAWMGDRAQGPYNSVAWYAISPESDPTQVDQDDWRELFPDQRVCENSATTCNHLARYETMWVDEGDYFHIRAGHKFNHFNAWTVFGIDDINVRLSDADVVAPEDGWVDDGDVTWDPAAPR